VRIRKQPARLLWRTFSTTRGASDPFHSKKSDLYHCAAPACIHLQRPAHWVLADSGKTISSSRSIWWAPGVDRYTLPHFSPSGRKKNQLIIIYHSVQFAFRLSLHTTNKSVGTHQIEMTRVTSDNKPLFAAPPCTSELIFSVETSTKAGLITNRC